MLSTDSPVRRLKPTSILGKREVKALTAAMLELLPVALSHTQFARLDLESSIRFGAVAARCHAKREEIGCTIKDVASRLRVPQFRLLAIETGQLAEIQPDVLARYIEFLGLERWTTRWARANESLARRLDLIRRA